MRGMPILTLGTVLIMAIVWKGWPVGQPSKNAGNIHQTPLVDGGPGTAGIRFGHGGEDLARFERGRRNEARAVVDGVMRSLINKGLLEEAGRSEGPGRPILYSTTALFLNHFGLSFNFDLFDYQKDYPAPL